MVGSPAPGDARRSFSNTVDVAFGPDGSTFDKPVTLAIDYSMTPYDPSASYSRYAMPDGVERWGSVDRGNPGHTEDVKKF